MSKNVHPLIWTDPIPLENKTPGKSSGGSLTEILWRIAEKEHPPWFGQNKPLEKMLWCKALEGSPSVVSSRGYWSCMLWRKRKPQTIEEFEINSSGVVQCYRVEYYKQKSPEEWRQWETIFSTGMWWCESFIGECWNHYKNDEEDPEKRVPNCIHKLAPGDFSNRNEKTLRKPPYTEAKR